MPEPAASPGVPQPVVGALEGTPEIGAEEAAFLILTVDVDGAPHVTLLSRAELATSGSQILVTLSGRSTPRNIDRTGTAALFAVVDDTAYTCHLQARGRAVEARMVGYRFEVISHRADSLGIPLTPITYVTPPELPSIERWATSARLLARLGGRCDPS